MDRAPHLEGPPSPPVLFVVTGFGPFLGVASNPTTTLAETIVDYLHQSGRVEIARCTRTLVIETSAASVASVIESLYRTLANEKTFVVMLHLGVNYQGTNFCLEQCAYNEATFRCPDEQGYQPRNETIVKNRTLGEALTTKINVQALVDRLNSTTTTKNGTPLASVSTDPGRFVCNYIYSYSLDRFQCSNDDPNCQFRCLFLHVPPFSVIPHDVQQAFLARLMEELREQVSAPSS